MHGRTVGRGDVATRQVAPRRRDRRRTRPAAGRAAAGDRRPAATAGPTGAPRPQRSGPPGSRDPPGAARQPAPAVRRPARGDRSSPAPGPAWGLYRDVTAGITTTDVIGRRLGRRTGRTSCWSGVDSRTDAQGNPLPPEVLPELHSGAGHRRDQLRHDHPAACAGRRRRRGRVLHPPGQLRRHPGHRRDKINAAYPAVQGRDRGAAGGRGASDRRGSRPSPREAGRQRPGRRGRGPHRAHRVDHYAELNLAGFHALTSAIGGVDVCLKAAVNEPLSGARFTAGPQTISGARRAGVRPAAARPARRRSVPDPAPAGVPGRGGRQGPVRTHPHRPGQARRAGRGDAVRRWSSTPNWDLLAFAQQAADIAGRQPPLPDHPDPGAARPTSAATSCWSTRTRCTAFVEQPDRRAGGGRRGRARTRREPPPPLTGLIPGRYVVDVRNASETVGLAAAVAEHVRGLGFVRGSVDNSAPSRTRWCTTPAPTATPPTAGRAARAASTVDERRRDRPRAPAGDAGLRLRPEPGAGAGHGARPGPPRPTRRTSPRPGCPASTEPGLRSRV